MIDAHCHLQFEAFDADWREVAQRALEVGVTGALIAGYDARCVTVLNALRQSTTPAGFTSWRALGLHPWAVHELDDQAVTQHLTVISTALERAGDWEAVGECGLDYAVARDGAARARQREALIAQLDLAARHALPVVLHAVRCHDELLTLLRRRATHVRGGQLHGYSGAAALAPRFVELGYHISFGAALTWGGRGDAAREALRQVARCDDARWTLETDAPGQPVASRQRGERGECADLLEVARAAAQVLARPLEEIMEVSARNTRALFRCAPDEAPVRQDPLSDEVL